MNATLKICVDERVLSEKARRFFSGATGSRCRARNESATDRILQLRRKLINETESYLSDPHSIPWARAS